MTVKGSGDIVAKSQLEHRISKIVCFGNLLDCLQDWGLKA